MCTHDIHTYDDVIQFECSMHVHVRKEKKNGVINVATNYFRYTSINSDIKLFGYMILWMVKRNHDWMNHGFSFIGGGGGGEGRGGVGGVGGFDC